MAEGSSGERVKVRLPSLLLITSPTSPFASNPRPDRAFPIASSSKNSPAFTLFGFGAASEYAPSNECSLEYYGGLWPARGSHLRFRADQDKSVRSRTIQRGAGERFGPGIIKSNPVHRICSITARGLSAECDRNIKHIPMRPR